MVDLNRENIDGFVVREFYVELVSDLKKRGVNQIKLLGLYDFFFPPDTKFLQEKCKISAIVPM